MDLEFLPLLQTQRDLLDIPRGFERFRQYLAAMTDERGELAVPLAGFNPMSKPHVAATLDHLLALGAEGAARDALADAAAWLPAVGARLRVGLVVADDAQGGWTNRYFTDAASRFALAAMLKRGFATPLLWTGETASLEGVSAAVLATAYRAAYWTRHGQPRTLRAMLTQEGYTAAFATAGRETTSLHATLDATALATTRAVVAPHLDSTDYPALFACLYGDEAAISVGYPPLGVPPWGGFALALEEAREKGWDVIEALAVGEVRREFGR